MFNPEKIIQLEGSRVLTNKGRIFAQYVDMTGKTYWTEVGLPFFNEEKMDKNPVGTSKFYEAVSPKEKFNNANNISDLID